MEVEFKFQVPADSRKAIEKELRSAKVTRTHLLARYFDTENGVLASHGVALRLRKEGRRWVQTAKALGDGAVHRLEHNADLGAVRGAPPAVDASRHRGTPVGERLDALLGEAGQPLIETFATDIWRTARRVQEGATTVELALDIGRVYAPAAGERAERSSPVCELELELVEGEVAGLVALAQRWSQQHGLWFSTVSKAERGERLRAQEPDRPRAVKAKPPQVAGEKAVAGGEVQRAVLAACLGQVLPNATEVAAGSEDAEVIHQLRVGIRRLRSALRELEPLAPGRFDAAWEPPLVEAFRALGAQRDRELLVTSLQPRLLAAGSPPIVLPEEEGEAAPSAREVVQAPKFQAALVSLIGFAAPPDVTPEADKDEAQATRRALAKGLNKLHRQVTRDGKRFEGLASEDQHRVRKRLKRLRYLAEFVAPLFDKQRAERYIQRLLPAQDALGEFNDEVVALATYGEAVAQEPRAWFAVGWLTALRPGKARACRKTLGGLAKARKFWK
ncbi:MAG TPA: CHAD domain-containing protein [Variovorax sp.]|nr:CHAD domain-containing protein [Variovorax sp.]